MVITLISNVLKYVCFQIHARRLCIADLNVVITIYKPVVTIVVGLGVVTSSVVITGIVVVSVNTGVVPSVDIVTTGVVISVVTRVVSSEKVRVSNRLTQNLVIYRLKYLTF